MGCVNEGGAVGVCTDGAGTAGDAGMRTGTMVTLVRISLRRSKRSLGLTMVVAWAAEFAGATLTLSANS